MPSRAHKKLIERIENLDKVPDDATDFAAWIKADGHLALLRDNAEEDELIIYRFNAHNRTFINTVVVSEDCLNPLDQDDLLQWFSDDLSSSVRYRWGSGEDSIYIERGHSWHAKSLRDAQQLVFTRNFTGLEQTDAFDFEVLQEYAHLTEIHLRPELHGYCRFDENGDFDHIVSVTSQEDQGRNSLITFKRKPLEEYLAASNSVLVRMFDFVLMRRGKDYESPRWPSGPGDLIRESDSLFYYRKTVSGKAAKTCGVQVIPPSRPKSEILSSMEEGQAGRNEGPYVEFIAWDWRNDRIAEISTDPSATTSYSQDHENSLPYEHSIACFSPDVLAKYKADQDKYTIRSDMISCRSAWVLRRYAVNEAGQVHAYICDLRDLPYKEQLYWLSFNEKPNGETSQIIIGSGAGPLNRVLSIAERWQYYDATWWKLRDESLLTRVSTPHTASRDEWAKAFLDLSKLVIEGFQEKAIKTRLSEIGIAFDEKENSIALIERLLIAYYELGEGERLGGLREVQLVRSKVSAHSGGSNARALAKNALQEHDTYAAHFGRVCKTVADELKLIEYAFS